MYELISANPVSLPRDKIVGSSFSAFHILIISIRIIVTDSICLKTTAESSEKEELSKLEKIGASMQSEIDRLKAQISTTESELSSIPGP